MYLSFGVTHQVVPILRVFHDAYIRPGVMQHAEMTV